MIFSLLIIIEEKPKGIKTSKETVCDVPFYLFGVSVGYQ